LSLKPPAEQAWAPEFARVPWAGRTDDQVTIHDARSFAYRMEHDFDALRETRTIDLRRVIGADLFLIHRGAPTIAHSIVRFRFADGTYLAASSEARRTATREFSAFRGFFRHFQVSCLVAVERDVLRLRTNYRENEEVYFYRTRLKPADARALLEAYLRWMNPARAEPQWYNALTRNCGTRLTTFAAQEKIGGIRRWGWRRILAGNGDKMLYQLCDLASDTLPFYALKRQAFTDRVAR